VNIFEFVALMLLKIHPSGAVEAYMNDAAHGPVRTSGSKPLMLKQLQSIRLSRAHSAANSHKQMTLRDLIYSK
jgi:hypothetical protein